jgi:hypothetical protein
MDQRVQRLDRAFQGQISAKVARLASAAHQRNHGGEGRDVPSGGQPLVDQHRVVVAESDQGPHRSCEALGDRDGPEVGLGQAAVGLKDGLVEDGAQQGLAGGEVTVDGAAGHAGGLGDRAHGWVLVPCQELGGRPGDRGRCGLAVRPVMVSLGLNATVTVS